MHWLEQLKAKLISDGPFQAELLAEFRRLLVKDSTGSLSEPDELRIFELVDSLGLSIREVESERAKFFCEM